MAAQFSLSTPLFVTQKLLEQYSRSFFHVLVLRQKLHIHHHHHLFVTANNHTTCSNRNDNATGRTRLTLLYSRHKVRIKQEGLAVASIARDDLSTLPGDDPFPRAHALNYK